MKTKNLLFILFIIFSQLINAITPLQNTWSVIATPLTSGNLPMTASGTLIWGDYNNDGQMDAFIIAGQGSSVVGLYKNNGNETFTSISSGITALNQGSAIFLDYNNDGNLDLLIAGYDGSAAKTILYKNSGAPDYTFSVDAGNSIVDVYPEGNDNSSRILEAFDYDNDGWTDILVNGNHGSTWTENGSSRVVALYKNNHGVFELQKTPYNSGHFTPMNGGSINIGDVNNDGFSDFIISGYESGSVTYLYINNQDGTFNKYSQAIFTGHMQGETVFVDVNGDGWNDIVETGRDTQNGWASFANLFINNKDNTFTKIGSSTSKLVGGQSRIAAGDINNDGLTDLVAVGWSTGSKIFYNNGDNTFTTVLIPEEARARNGAVNLVDFNNDLNLDLSNFGYKGDDATANTVTWPNVFVKNTLGNGIPSNTAPAAPQNLTYIYSNNQYTLNWDKSTDDFTPADALRYNFYILFEDNSIFGFIPADITSGKLKVNGIKPLVQTNSIKLNLPAGNYTIGVSAVDQAYVSSPFTTLKIINNPTGIKTSELNNVKIHTLNKVVDIMNNSKNKLSFNILTLDGKMIKSGTIDAETSSSVTMSSQGIYLLKLNDNNSTRAEKLIIR